MKWVGKVSAGSVYILCWPLNIVRVFETRSFSILTRGILCCSIIVYFTNKIIWIFLVSVFWTGKDQRGLSSK